MMSSHVLLQIVFVPALASLGIYLFREPLGKRAGWVAVAGLIYTTVLLVLTGLRIWHGAGSVHETYLLIAPDITLGLMADGLSLAVGLIANVLCLVLATFSIRYIDHRIEIIYEGVGARREASYYTRFYYLFLFFPMGFMGVSFATNLIGMYFFLESLTITLYFLMAYFGYIERVRIAMMCLLWGIFSAVFFLAASLLVYAQLGSFEIARMSALAGNPMAFWVIAIFLIGLFAKLAVFPFHVWMPWVHAEHPTCIAGLLAVYANIAAYIIVRALILPLFHDFQVFGPPIMVLALITMVYGSFLTLAQTDIKRVAACSTISQIAYSMLGIGALTAVSIEGGMFFFLSHIMGKTIFFSTAGIVVYITHIRNIENAHHGDALFLRGDDAVGVSALQQLCRGVDPLCRGLRARRNRFAGPDRRDPRGGGDPIDRGIHLSRRQENFLRPPGRRPGQSPHQGPAAQHVDPSHSPDLPLGRHGALPPRRHGPPAPGHQRRSNGGVAAYSLTLLPPWLRSPRQAHKGGPLAAEKGGLFTHPRGTSEI